MAKRKKETHEEYWNRRTRELWEWVDRQEIDIYYELEKIYLEASKEVQDELLKFYGKYAEDNQITLQQAKKRLKGVDLSDYQSNAKKYFEQVEEDKDPELLERLNEQYASSQATRLDALNLELTWKIGALNGSLQIAFEEYLKQVATDSYRKIMGGLPAGTLSEHSIKQVIEMPWNGYNYSEGLWGNTDNLAAKLKDTLTKGFIKGHGIDQMSSQIRKDFNVAKSRANTLVRTDGSNVVNNATAKRYKDAGLEYYRLLVHIDSRTTEICMSHHRENKLYKLSDYKSGVTAPPFHYSCRTSIVPDDEELGLEDFRNY